MQYKIVLYKIDAYGVEYKLSGVVFPDKKNGPLLNKQNEAWDNKMN